jgi:CMP/dCMP kinase
MIISVGGLVGSGKSTLAKALAERYGFKYISIGHIMRDMAKENGMSILEFSKLAETDPKIDKELDERQKRITSGDCIIDSRLAAFVLKPDLKIWLTTSLNVRASRLASRDEKSPEEGLREVREREASERKRYMEIYGYDLNDLSIYDLIINTGLFDVEPTVQICSKAIDSQRK